MARELKKRWSERHHFCLFVPGSTSPKPGSTPKPQLLLFSATVPSWVRQTADRYMTPDKVVVDLIGQQTLKTSVTVEHKAICCPYSERPSTIADVIQVGGVGVARRLWWAW